MLNHLVLLRHYKTVQTRGLLLIDFVVQLTKIIQISVLAQLIKAGLCLSYSNCQ